MILPLYTLLVSGEPVEAVLEALRRAGYDPRSEYVSTPGAFSAALEQREWDVVIVCHDDADLSVWEALGWLQHRSACPPVLVVGDGLDEADIVALIGEGVRDVIKPVHHARLGVAVAKAMRSQREQAPARPEAAPGTPPESAFQALAEHMPIGLYRTTDDGRILYANPALARILGYDSLDELLSEEVISNIKYPREDFAQKIRTDGEVRNLEVQWERADGEVIVTRENTRGVRDAAGTLLYYEGTIEDITEERRALHVEQHRARQLEAIVRFSAAVDAAQSSDDLDGAIIRVVEDALGADAAAFLRHSADGFDVQAWSASIAEEVHACREQEVWKAYPVRTKPLLVRDEGVLESPLLVEPMRDAMRRAGLRSLGSFPLIHRGQPVGALVAFFREPHTFTESELRMVETLAWHVAGAVTRWQAERELRDSEASLRTITATTGHVLYRRRFGADAFEHVSASIEKLTGYSARALSDRGGLDALIETREVIEGEALQAGDGGTDAHYLALYGLRTAGGDLRWVEDSAYPWTDDTGEVAGLVGVLQDVTERREREEAAHRQARRSLAQQKALNELSTLNAEAEAVLSRTTEVAAQAVGAGRFALWLLDEESREMRCHDLYVLEEGRHRADIAFRADAVADAVEMLGRNRVLATTDILKKPLSERVGLDVYHARNGVRAVLTAPVRREGRVIGFVAFEHLGAPRVWTLDEQDFAGAVADLVALVLERGQRAEAEAALRDSELRNRVISELAADYAHALTAEPGGRLRLAWATDAFERISGYNPDEVRDVDGLIRLVHEADRPALEQEIERLKAGHTVELELRITTKTGDERWVSHRSRPVLDAHGAVHHVYSTGQDITDRKRFEAALVAAREEAEGMAQQKSAFLANMSHEIRTPLTGILGFAGVLVEEVKGEQREYARLIERSGRRLLDTLNSVLDLAKLESDGLQLTPEPLDVIDEARQVVLLLSPLADEKKLDLRLRTQETELIAPLDAVCLHRILNNLVGNAIKFTEAGHVTVGAAADGDRVRIDVQDSGIGIDEEFLPYLFDEFKQEVQGTNREGSGLGLAITMKLVERMAGTLAVESEKGKGSRFTITFPRIIEPGRLEEAVGRAVARREDVQRRAAREVSETEEGSFDLSALIFTSPFGPGGEVVIGAPAEPAEANPPPSAPEKTAGPKAVPASTHRSEGSVPEPEVSVAEDEFMLKDLVPLVEAEPAGSDGDAMEGFLSLSEVSLRVAEAKEPKAAAHRVTALWGEGASSSRPSDTGGRPRVLLVEDDPEILRLLERMLHGAYAVEAATEARAALDRMAKVTYDAFVLDVNLGGSQRGVNVLRVARTLPRYDRAVAVALTPTGSSDDHFLKAGFNRCVSKPFTKEKLLAALDRTAAGALK